MDLTQEQKDFYEQHKEELKSFPIYEILQAEQLFDTVNSTFPAYTEKIGHYFLLEDAVRTVENNVCDIADGGCYMYVWIVKRESGLYNYSTPESRLLFQFDRNTKKYNKIDEPKRYKQWSF